MITTLENVKNLIGISQENDAFDSQIISYLPIVQDQIADFCNNNFADLNNYTSGTAVFVPATATNPAKITLQGANFISEAQFSAGMDIYISGSNFNDGYYEILTVTETIIEFAHQPKIYVETSDYSVYVFRVKFPKPLESIAASMIADRIQRPSGSSATDTVTKSERIGDYSITYDLKLKDWKSIYREDLRPYMKPKFIKSKGSNLTNDNFDLVHS